MMLATANPISGLIFDILGHISFILLGLMALIWDLAEYQTNFLTQAFTFRQNPVSQCRPTASIGAISQCGQGPPRLIRPAELTAMPRVEAVCARTRSVDANLFFFSTDTVASSRPLQLWCSDIRWGVIECHRAEKSVDAKEGKNGRF
jgi:hypothetical protein